MITTIPHKVRYVPASCVVDPDPNWIRNQQLFVKIFLFAALGLFYLCVPPLLGVLHHLKLTFWNV